jgi:uncharacterized protein (DUF2336 family)
METAGLSALAGLIDLGLRSAAGMRPSLLRILADLYLQKLRHTPEEERHYTELALCLLDGVDAETRAAVTGRLANDLSPPLTVLQHLSRDLPEVAQVLRSYPTLQARAPAQMAVRLPDQMHSTSGSEHDAADEDDDSFADVTPAVDPATAG